MSRPTAWCASPRASARAIPPYATSLGRALLAFEHEDVRNHYLDTGSFTPFTEHTVTGRAELRKLFHEVRRSGYAATQDELDYGLISIAVPILDDSGRSLAAINCSTSTSRVSKDELIRTRLPILAAAARTIETALRRQPYCCARSTPTEWPQKPLGQVDAPAHRLALEDEAAGRVFGVVALVEQVLRPRGGLPGVVVRFQADAQVHEIDRSRATGTASPAAGTGITKIVGPIRLSSKRIMPFTPSHSGRSYCRPTFSV